MGAHLEPIGLHQVERSQHAIEPGEYREMLLGIAKVGCRILRKVEARVDIALECQDRSARIVLTERAVPFFVALEIQVGQLFADSHQFT